MGQIRWGGRSRLRRKAPDDGKEAQLVISGVVPQRSCIWRNSDNLAAEEDIGS